MSEITITLESDAGVAKVPGGTVTVLSRGRPCWTGEVRRVSLRTVTVRVYNSDRTWWEGTYPLARIRIGAPT